MAEGARIISIAFREPPKSMFPADSGIGAHGPDHLTFDLADSSKLSLSFYGKRPGPGMQLDKLSLQFALHETEHETDVLEAYERLIHDAMSGDSTLFTAAEDIERLWELSAPLLEDPPDVEFYEPGSWGPAGHPRPHPAQRLAAALRARVAQGRRPAELGPVRRGHRSTGTHGRSDRLGPVVHHPPAVPGHQAPVGAERLAELGELLRTVGMPSRPQARPKPARTP